MTVTFGHVGESALALCVENCVSWIAWREAHHFCDNVCQLFVLVLPSLPWVFVCNLNCSGLVFGLVCRVLVIVVLIDVSVATRVLVIGPLPHSVVGLHVIFVIVVAAASTVGGAIELFVGKVVFCCVEDILESVRFISWVSGI